MDKKIKLVDASNDMLVAAWNVLQFSKRMISDKTGLQDDIDSVSKELKNRGIAHENGKRITKIISK